MKTDMQERRKGEGERGKRIQSDTREKEREISLGGNDQEKRREEETKKEEKKRKKKKKGED